MKVAVKTLENKAAGDITLDKDIFGVEVREDIVHRVVNYQMAARRAGTAKAKQRNEITGTGAKPWRQKGTGRARAGDLKRPQDVGGGVAHGPVARSFGYKLPKKIRQLAMKCVLSAKAAEGKLIILDEAKAKTHKTKPMVEAMKKLGVESAVIVGGTEIDVNFARASANLPRIDVLPSQGANVYDILRRDTLILTKQAVQDITSRLKEKAANPASAKTEKPAAEKKKASQAAKKTKSTKAGGNKKPAKTAKKETK